MLIHYISPSILPSRSANSIHVMLQCNALANLGHKVKIYAKRSINDQNEFQIKVSDFYGVHKNVEFVTFYNSFTFGSNFFIAIISILKIIIFKNCEVIISRNLYAAFVLGILLKRKIIYETHHLEIGLRKFLQFYLLSSKYVNTVVISNKLHRSLEEYHKICILSYKVLHDAALKNNEILPPQKRRKRLKSIVNESNFDWKVVCGYFGHLYEGRGIEIIEGLANRHKDCLFLVYGGNESEIKNFKKKNNLDNLIFGGYLTHRLARKHMSLMDVLLMPYQDRVSIGVSGYNTSCWMSPMKMFEYLSTAVPIISSDLPVLREVLKNNENALLVPPSDILEWSIALNKLKENRKFAQIIGQNGYKCFIKNYTWEHRAKNLINLWQKF